MSGSKPTIVLIPGAWLPISAYEGYLSALREVGYPTTAIQYPSFDPVDPFTADVANDASAVRAALLPLLGEGKELVLVLHSYGGVPGSAAAKGHSVSERRAAGLPGGILGLVFVAAFIVPEGQTCVGLTGGKILPWILPNTPGAGLNVPEDPSRMFGRDYAAGVTEVLAASLKPHASLAFESVQPPVAVTDDAYGGRIGYIATTRDEEVPREAQDAMMSGVNKTWIVREVEGSHMSPFGGQFLSDSIRVLSEMVDSFKST
jgi:pimeloyl-ACP methyl ester carboxylesterase